MQTFVWSTLFETGLPEVDSQHRRLVELVNQLGEDANSSNEERIDQALQALADYTVYHFRCEEGIMQSAGVWPAHVDHHRAVHRKFIDQVGAWIAGRQQNSGIGLFQLLDFLSNWLIFHILGDDQSFSRQVSAIKSGTSAKAAFEQDRASEDPRTDILLAALRRLYSGLVARNEELLDAKDALAALNRDLEKRVEERTRQLEETNASLREERERVIEFEKMALLGRLVAGFAHEVNTPIGIAVGATSQSQEVLNDLDQLLLGEEVSEDDLRARISTLYETTDLALSSLRRAADMVRSFKRTAVDQTSDLERDYLLAEVIEDVTRNLHNEFKNTGITIETVCPPDLLVHGKAGDLGQVLTNLMQNSRVHGFDNGTRAGTISVKARLDGDTVCIHYQDNGKGMSDETRAHAFEPFFTTMRGQGGSGLGLYIVYNLVTQGLQGTITLESTRGTGCGFVMVFPRVTTAIEKAS